jgi:signal transduction histidine kinase
MRAEELQSSLAEVAWAPPRPREPDVDTVPPAPLPAGLGDDALRDILDALPAIVNVKDRASRYVFMNAYQARLYGTSPAGARGRSAAELLGTRYGDYTKDIDRSVVESGRVFANYRETYALADGAERSFLTTKLPWRRAGGAIAGTITISLDVSEKHASDRALADALIRSEAANRAKSAFLANMSHELRTPLNAVIGFAELLAGGSVRDPARVKDYAGSIVAGARRLLDVIDGVLEFARLEAEPPSAEPDAFALAALVRECLADAAGAARAGGVTLSSELADDLPAVHADRRAVRRMLDALLSNAIKFSPRGGPVRVAADRSAPGGGLAVSVVDRGIGIAPEDLRACLEPFGQVEGALARRFSGMGLGLTLVRTLIERQGGRLALASAPGAGTTARLLFAPVGPANGSISH